jgi:hypothetical protein
MSKLEIRGEGLVIRGGPSPSAETGLFVGRDGLQGWQGLPARRREAMVRSLADGEHDVPVRLPARVITIDPGVILARSEYELQRWCDAVNGWGATGSRFDLTVTHLGQVLTATVRVIQAEGVDLQRRAGGLLRGSFSAQMVAADPRKYAEPRTFPVAVAEGTVLVDSRGNFPAHPVIEFDNPPSTYVVTSPGGSFVVTAPAGGTHRVDMATGRVTRNGVFLQGAGLGRLWAIPNDAQWPVIMSSPGRVIVRDTFA